MPIIGGSPIPARDQIPSPAELLSIFLDETLDRDIVPAGAVVGGADDPEQQRGVVVLMDAGNSRNDYLEALLWKRIQVRCMAASLWEADRIGNYVSDLLDGQKNLEIRDSRNQEWFIHGTYVVAGTSHHIDSTETWEVLLFVNITVGRDPIP